MRRLTWFLPPSAGTANVAGFDVLEQPLEVKKRIGDLPETPPIYLGDVKILLKTPQQ
jgi:ABC-2 type transport system ATP-binding protein